MGLCAGVRTLATTRLIPEPEPMVTFQATGVLLGFFILFSLRFIASKSIPMSRDCFSCSSKNSVMTQIGTQEPKEPLSTKQIFLILFNFLY
ncbi:hypothetical protein HanRHA438_Chr02g0095531 [Helianthus annuus]|nr:hypothetical protein HanIR_Chr02g0097281 [Helianthus annuus]KAJ0941534.1 hypothetical protein HanRHA438_Chr02g0095531 [Helianthus annuus]